jgi:excisionase family DNA binding protein
MAAEYMTVEEFGEYVRVGRMTAYRLVWSGAVQRINIAPRGAKRPSWRVSRSAADAFMAGNAKGGQAASGRTARKVA